jgi:hypothetical protein
MTFTTPCFVRVENPEKRKELIKWLKGIGYRILFSARHSLIESELRYISAHKQGYVMADSPLSCDEWIESIDCGENIELFKALAAMNDENDREQWFVSNEGSEWAICKKTLNVYSGVLCRKATAEEIVEYFKNKEL